MLYLYVVSPSFSISFKKKCKNLWCHISILNLTPFLLLNFSFLTSCPEFRSRFMREGRVGSLIKPPSISIHIFMTYTQKNRDSIQLQLARLIWMDFQWIRHIFHCFWWSKRSRRTNYTLWIFITLENRLSVKPLSTDLESKIPVAVWRTVW